MATLQTGFQPIYDIKKPSLLTGVAPCYALASKPEVQDVSVANRVHYIFTAGGKEIPISSFQSRLKIEGTSFLSTVVPAGSKWNSFLLANINTQMTIKRRVIFTGGEIVESVIAAAIIDQVLQYRGIDSSTLQVNGHATYSTPASPRTIKIPSITYIANNDSGTITFRSPPLSALQPGDIAIVESKDYKVKEIIHMVDAEASLMEVSCE